LVIEFDERLDIHEKEGIIDSDIGVLPYERVLSVFHIEFQHFHEDVR